MDLNKPWIWNKPPLRIRVFMPWSHLLVKPSHMSHTRRFLWKLAGRRPCNSRIEPITALYMYVAAYDIMLSLKICTAMQKMPPSPNHSHTVPSHVSFNPLETIWFCYNMHFPLYPSPSILGTTCSLQRVNPSLVLTFGFTIEEVMHDVSCNSCFFWLCIYLSVVNSLHVLIFLFKKC